MRRFLLAASIAAIALSASSLAQAQTQMKASMAAGTTASGERFAFTDEDRVILRRYVHPRVAFGTTTGSESGDGVTPGEVIPDSVMLHPLPGAVSRESPHLGAYRYIQVGGRAYVVDPRDRMVIEEID
jgi:hypothetical protein